MVATLSFEFTTTVAEDVKLIKGSGRFDHTLVYTLDDGDMEKVKVNRIREVRIKGLLLKEGTHEITVEHVVWDVGGATLAHKFRLARGRASLNMTIEGTRVDGQTALKLWNRDSKKLDEIKW